ncbi:hypothetical protein [Pseudomonas sp. NPDC007930]|uniref:hypothetical protein n=1 Tax=Pseudomonas sp. NPDC007930 TaxID=3364417 RepID=UPI0036EE6D92
MAVTPVDSTQSSTDTQAQFDAAVDSSSEMTDEELTNELVSQGVIIGGQFILMPKAQEMLNDAMSDDDDE